MDIVVDSTKKKWQFSLIILELLAVLFQPRHFLVLVARHLFEALLFVGDVGAQLAAVEEAAVHAHDGAAGGVGVAELDLDHAVGFRVEDFDVRHLAPLLVRGLLADVLRELDQELRLCLLCLSDGVCWDKWKRHTSSDSRVNMCLTITVLSHLLPGLTSFSSTEGSSSSQSASRAFIWLVMRLIFSTSRFDLRDRAAGSWYSLVFLNDMSASCTRMEPELPVRKSVPSRR